MQIRLNNEAKTVDDHVTLGRLIDSLDLNRQFIAVEVNQELVPRESIDSHILCEGDSVEIVTLVGGG